VLLKSIASLRQLGPEIQWIHSDVTGDTIDCVYRAPDAATIEEHARPTGIPANRISPVSRVLDPANIE
jgi:hypothetical protein